MNTEHYSLSEPCVRDDEMFLHHLQGTRNKDCQSRHEKSFHHPCLVIRIITITGMIYEKYNHLDLFLLLISSSCWGLRVVRQAGTGMGVQRERKAKKKKMELEEGKHRRLNDYPEAFPISQKRTFLL